MKKLKLTSLNMGEVLTRELMKKVVGGYGDSCSSDTICGSNCSTSAGAGTKCSIKPNTNSCTCGGF